MYIRQFTLVLFLLIALTSFAQNLDHPTSTSLIFSPKESFQATANGGEQISFIPLKFHTIVDNNSWYNDTARITTLIDVANEKFSESNVQFFQCGAINKIEDAQFANGFDPASIMFNLHETHGVEFAINVYIPNSITSFNGYSYSGPNGIDDYAVQFNGLVINGTETLSNDPMLFCHELGHYFGLYHTQSPPLSLELVDGSNCSLAGDYCCDTPAEYQGMCCADLSDCTYVPLFGDFIDANGDTLVADVQNIMSVMQFNMACRDHFTPDQVERINYYHANFLSDLACPGQNPTSISDESPTSEVFIYPNPSTDQVKITWDQDAGVTEVRVFTITGSLLLSTFTNTNQLVIDTESWNSGVYSVCLKSRDSQLFSRLVVQKK
ncbi:MAG: zinc-dependent metalloprotease [Flavobacteriales bacterium]